MRCNVTFSSQQIDPSNPQQTHSINTNHCSSDCCFPVLFVHEGLQNANSSSLSSEGQDIPTSRNLTHLFPFAFPLSISFFVAFPSADSLTGFLGIVQGFGRLSFGFTVLLSSIDRCSMISDPPVSVRTPRFLRRMTKSSVLISVTGDGEAA